MKKFSIFFSALSFLICIDSFGQKQENEKQAGQEFKVNKKNIKIHSSSRNIEIQSWKEDKLKIIADAVSGNDYSPEMLEKAVSVHEMSNSINININGLNSGNSGSSKITIYAPKSSKIIIDNKYANLNFKNDFDNLDIDITNGNLDCENVGELKLSSKYGNANLGDIKNADIDFTNGNLSATSFHNAEIDTKYSNIEIGTANKINFISTNDEYEIDEAGEISGRKNYGNLRISKLNSSIDLEGTNADIKIKNIAAAVSSIKIDDKYANLRLPLRNLKDYSVDVKGAYNTVYPDKSTADLVNNSSSESGDSFNAKSGTGTGARIQIKCSNCTVDLK